MNHQWYRLLDGRIRGRSGKDIAVKVAADFSVSPIFACTFITGVAVLEGKHPSTALLEYRSKFFKILMSRITANFRIFHPMDMLGWTIDDWLSAYRSGSKPSELLSKLLDQQSLSDVAWICLVSRAHLEWQLEGLDSRRGDIVDYDELLSSLPLYGVPFAVKDNIDVEGLPTTAACPVFAYQPTKSAFVIERLTAAGAVVIGKTNLDQFACGLVGIHSPHGAVPNAFNSEYISGGSSSGSASVVARGIVPFSLGSDTAGSGRIPAGLNNIVGLKPTPGAISGSGVVKACRTLDCVSFFATRVTDAHKVYKLAAGYDAADSYSLRPPPGIPSTSPPHLSFAVPASLDFYGDHQSSSAFDSALKQLEAWGATVNLIDFGVFEQVSALLYDGPWVAERYAAIEQFVETHSDAIRPLTRKILFRAKNFSASDTFNAIYKLADLKRKADGLMESVDVLLVPTAATHFKIAEVEEDPIRPINILGRYSNFVNLLGYSALSVPAGFRADKLPFGVTLVAPGWRDDMLAQIGQRWEEQLALSRGATGLPFKKS